MAESLQHKLDRVRRPRVHITYDVETGGALKKTELPFVVGVLADLSGQPKQALPGLKDRKAVYIDRDNFNEVLARSGARLALRVPNMLTDPDSKLAVELNFKHIDDFEPARVAEQIEPLKQLLDMRQELTQLLSRMEGNDKLGELLEGILANQEKATAVGQLIDKQTGKSPTAAPVKSTAPPAVAQAPKPAAPASATPVPKPPAPPGAAAVSRPPAPPAPPGAAAAPRPPAPPAPPGAAAAPRPPAPPGGAAAPRPPAPPAPPGAAAAPRPPAPPGAAAAPRPPAPPGAAAAPKPPAAPSAAAPVPKPPAPAPTASAPPTPPAPPAPPAPPPTGGGQTPG